MTEVLTSICIPSYNHLRYLDQSVSSALAQTYRNIEVIVNDDCSTDGSFELLQSFNHHRLKVSQNKKNQGITHNWNTCCKLASGKYIIMLPSDDVLYPNHSATLTKLMEDNPSVGFCGSAIDYIDPSGMVFDSKCRKRLGRGKVAISSGKSQFWGYCMGPRVPFPGTIFRRDLYEKLGGFNCSLQICEDWEFWVRCLAHADEAFVNEPLVAFRWSETNLSGRRDFVERHFNEMDTVWRQIITSSNRRLSVRAVVFLARLRKTFHYLRHCRTESQQVDKNTVVSLIGIEKGVAN